MSKILKGEMMFRMIQMFLLFSILIAGCAKHSMVSGLKEKHQFISADEPMIVVNINPETHPVETRTTTMNQLILFDYQSPIFQISKTQPLMVDYIFLNGYEYIAIDLRQADPYHFQKNTIEQFEENYEKIAIIGEIINRGRLQIDGVQMSYWDIVYSDESKRRYFARYMALLNSSNEMLQIRYSKYASPWEFEELLKVKSNQDDGKRMLKFYIDDLNELIDIKQPKKRS